MKNLFSLAVGLVFLFIADASFAQSGGMMHGNTWGDGWMSGFGGMWIPILLAVAVVVVAVWVIKQKK